MTTPVIKQELEEHEVDNDQDDNHERKMNVDIFSIDVKEMSEVGTEMNLLLHDKCRALLSTDPKLCFDSESEDHKKLVKFLQSLGKYLSQKVPSEWGHTDSRVKDFFVRTFNDFANEYLRSFLSQLPTKLTQVEIGGCILKPQAYCRKVSGDCFKARFRQRCIQKTYQL